jgi:hypothetical protein
MCDRSSGKKALKAATSAWDKRWFEVRSRNGGEFASKKFSGASVRWSLDITAEAPQKELALADAGLFLAPHMSDGYTLICPTGDPADPTSEVTCAP